jgi:peptidoglycan/LPS O-acetylase OafA/YrhL
LENFIFSTAVAGLILLLWNTKQSRLARFLVSPPFPYLGKISYGLYVFHLPCLVLASVWFAFMPHGSALPAFAMTVGLSALSWRVLEHPINNLKRYFPYEGVPRQPATLMSGSVG